MQERPPLMSLRNLAETLFMGVNFGRLPKASRGDGEVPFIQVKDVIEDVLTAIDRLDRIALPETTQNARQRLRDGDVLVSARGTLMKCAVVPRSHWGAVASANLIVIRLGQASPLRPELLWTHLRRPSVQSHILSRANSTAQASLNIRDLEELPIPVPPMAMQSDLVRLILIAEEQYRCAVECARLRQEEAMDIVAEHMDSYHAC